MSNEFLNFLVSVFNRFLKQGSNLGLRSSMVPLQPIKQTFGNGYLRKYKPYIF